MSDLQSQMASVRSVYTSPLFWPAGEAVKHDIALEVNIGSDDSFGAIDLSKAEMSVTTGLG